MCGSDRTFARHRSGRPSRWTLSASSRWRRSPTGSTWRRKGSTRNCNTSRLGGRGARVSGFRLAGSDDRQSQLPTTNAQPLPTSNSQLRSLRTIGSWELGVVGSWELGVVGSWELEIGNSGKQLVQMEMMLSELAAVVARRNLDDSRTTGGSQAGAQRLLDRRSIETIHDNLQH